MSVCANSQLNTAAASTVVNPAFPSWHRRSLYSPFNVMVFIIFVYDKYSLDMGAAILATPIAFGCGLLVKRWRENINRENMATMKVITNHYTTGPIKLNMKHVYVHCTQTYFTYQVDVNQTRTLKVPSLYFTI